MLQQIADLIGMPYTITPGTCTYTGTDSVTYSCKLGVSGYSLQVVSKFNEHYQSAPTYTASIYFSHPKLTTNLSVESEYGILEDCVVDVVKVMLRDFHHQSQLRHDDLTRVLSKVL